MPCKIVVTFQSSAQGFTESFYSLQNIQTAAAAVGSAFYTRALAFRAPLTVVQEVSFRDVANPRVALQRTPQGNFGADPLVANLPDVTSTDAFYSLTSSSQNRRRGIWLRGLQDDLVTRAQNGQSTPAPALVSKVNQYFTWLRNEWQITIRYINRNSPLTPNFRISAIQASPASTNFTNITTLAATGLVAGDRVLIGGVPQNVAPGLRGYFTILDTPSSGVITVAYHIPNLAAGSTISLLAGYFRKLAFAYDATVNDWTFRYFGTHKTGRVSAVSRGRSRPVVRRQ